MSDEVWFADTQQRLALLNPSALRAFALTAFDDINVQKFAASLEIYRSDGSPRPAGEAPLLCALGGEIIQNQEVDLSKQEVRCDIATVGANPVRNANGQIVGAVAVVHDITERRKAEEALWKEKERFRMLTQNLSSGIALIDESRRFAIVNPAFLRMFEISEESDIKNINDRNSADWQVFDEHGTPLDVDEHPVRKATRTGKAVLNQLVSMRPPASSALKSMLITAAPIFETGWSLEATFAHTRISRSKSRPRRPCAGATKN